MFTVWNHKAFPNFICRQYDKSGKQWDIWPIRAWYQNMVSWHSGIKGMSPGLAPLFPSPVHHSAHFPGQNFFCCTPFPHCGALSQTLYTKEKCFALFDTLYTSYHKQTHQRSKNHWHQIHRASNVCRFLLGEVKSVSVIHIYEFAAKRKKVNARWKQSITLLKAT